MRLKGLLWKPGVNGLGVWGIHCLPYRRKFDLAACAHDHSYDTGGDGADRKLADRTFYRDMRSLCTDRLQSAAAAFYYAMVRLFGWAFFRYNK